MPKRPADQAGTELDRRVFRASHSRIPEIVELSKKKSGDAAPTSHAPSNRATPAPGSRPSTTGSRSPSAWPTASTTRTIPSPSSCSAAADSTYAYPNQEPNPRKQQKPLTYLLIQGMEICSTCGWKRIMRDSERMLNGRGGRTVYRFNRLVVCGRIPIMRLRLVRVLSVWSNQLKMSGVSLLTFKKAWQIPGK